MPLKAKVRGAEVQLAGVEKTRSQTAWIPSPGLGEVRQAAVAVSVISLFLWKWRYNICLEWGPKQLN